MNSFDNILPWSGMKRCILTDSQKVLAYYGESGYIETGALTQAITKDGTTYPIGTFVQVMVEVPAFYYRRVVSGTDDSKTYIRMTAHPDFKRHPWFFDVAGNPVPYKYIGAFEGSIYDVSAGAYLLTDQQVADFNADKLCSIAGAKPCSGLTQDLNIVNSRKLANNRGTGWQQQYFMAVSAIQMLFAVEYASFNTQAKIGQGVVNKTDDGSTNMANNTGATSFLGNASGREVGTDGLTSVSYRGIENFWGNIWRWVDGINIQNTTPFISSVNGNFVSDVFTGQYKSAGANLKNANGYFSKSILTVDMDYGFLPADAVGTSNSYYADYFYQNGVGNFVLQLGGKWSNGLSVGAFCMQASDGSATRSRTIGARLCV